VNDESDPFKDNDKLIPKSEIERNENENEYKLMYYKESEPLNKLENKVNIEFS
jgi:hypothetical protein